MLQAFKNYYHLAQGVIAVKRAGSPARDMTVIGVTGTDGKTTTASLIYHLLKETGHKAALISTVGAFIGDEKLDIGFHVSTPNSAQLQSYIVRAKHQGVTHLVLEITSHALDQHRAYGIPFKIGVLTNVSREHLDYHKTMEKYMLTKAKLLKNSEIAVINRDDESFSFMKSELNGKKFISYGLENAADVNPQNHPFTSHLFGSFNTYNILAALSVADILKIESQKARKAISTFRLPEGRCDVVYKKDFTVIIDFAHTPNGLKNILESVHKEKKGRLIHVFGSAGERDKGKRQFMGEVAGTFDDVIILTAEDPRKEPVEIIISDIQKGISGKSEVITEPDRQKAITKAVELAQKDDIIVITGKGHEKSMNFGKGEVPWSDHEAVEKALKTRAKSK